MTQQTMARYLEHQNTIKAMQVQQQQDNNNSNNNGMMSLISASDVEIAVIAPYLTTASTTTGWDAPSSTTSRRTDTAAELQPNDGNRRHIIDTTSTTPPDEHLSSIGKVTRTVPVVHQRNDGSTTTTTTTTIPTMAADTSGTDDKKIIPKATPRHRAMNRKRTGTLVKNLPKPNIEPLTSPPESVMSSDDTSTYRSSISKSKSVTNGLDIQQYYRTELLTPDEEYALGMKIQFMDHCEQVHEGLSSALNRLPTMEEWAVACGYTDTDPNFVSTEADEQQLRPIGSDAMFDDIDPHLFIGNGLAHQTGPGSGRGRVKRVPPLGLNDFYDDSEYRSQLKRYLKLRRKDKSIPRPRRSELVRPINRGTPTHFVEMLMTAREAKQRMVQSNMRLVISIARKYCNAGVSLQDLVQEGSLGLSRAAEKFEPKKGFKFSTYASWWIQQAVFRSIAYHSRTIRLPVHVHNLLNRVRKVRQTLHGALGRVPTNEEVAVEMGMTRQKFNKMLHLTKQSISLETPKYRSNPKDLGHESDDLLGETISKSSILEDEATPQKSVDHGLFHDDLKNIMKILDDDEHRVICARYGLHDGLTRTVTTVAAQMKQSKAWVRSQECRALRKLRRPWYEKKLKEHQDALVS
jgi:RNA polymerase sigma factor (sigma-70 family)